MSHDHNSAGASHGNTKQYTIGFILSVILTVIPFGMVMAGGFGRGIVMAVIAITAVAQVLVQLVYFLHMNSSSEQRWNVIAFIYTILSYCYTSSRLCMDYELPTLQHDDLN